MKSKRFLYPVLFCFVFQSAIFIAGASERLIEAEHILASEYPWIESARSYHRLDPEDFALATAKNSEIFDYQQACADPKRPYDGVHPSKDPYTQALNKALEYLDDKIDFDRVNYSAAENKIINVFCQKIVKMIKKGGFLGDAHDHFIVYILSVLDKKPSYLHNPENVFSRVKDALAGYKLLGGSSLLHLAVEENNILFISYLLDDIEISVNEQDKEGNTPLHVAAQHNRLEAAKILGAAHPDIHIKNKKNQTPLQVAVGFNALDIATYLCQRPLQACCYISRKELDELMRLAGREGNQELVGVLSQYCLAPLKTGEGRELVFDKIFDWQAARNEDYVPVKHSRCSQGCAIS